jgi:hypothetical protein
VRRVGGGQVGEMVQTMYAHVNKRINSKKKFDCKYNKITIIFTKLYNSENISLP